jgi:hypothetical protein
MRCSYLFTALATIKESCLYVISDGEKRTASCVSSSVYPIGACDTLGDCSWGYTLDFRQQSAAHSMLTAGALKDSKEGDERKE